MIKDLDEFLDVFIDDELTEQERDVYVRKELAHDIREYWGLNLMEGEGEGVQ